ncbi:MAG TPA: hypothetical protein VGN34_14350 [Ktedonobacteraceae bacterium]|jgi:hypothetical protein
MDQNTLKLEWVKLPNGQTTGYFIDATGHNCAIAPAAFLSHDAITIANGNGALVLDRNMCAELCLVLAYFTMSGELPEPA